MCTWNRITKTYRGSTFRTCVRPKLWVRGPSREVILSTAGEQWPMIRRRTCLTRGGQTPTADQTKWARETYSAYWLPCANVSGKRILSISIFVVGSKPSTSPSISSSKQLVHMTMLPMEKHSLTPAILCFP